MNIHPTAIVSPEAAIADGVEIGPYAIIDGPARIEAGCRIGPHVCLLGRVILGSACQVGAGSILGADPQSIGFDPATASGVEIEKNNRIREYVTIHRSLHEGKNTRVGADNFIMTGVHFGHDVRIGNGNAIANNCLLGGHVEVGDHCFLGGGSAYHQFVKVGDHVMVQGASGISKDLAPFLMAASVNRIAGLNVVGLRRHGFSAEERQSLRRAYKLVFRSGMNLKQAMEEAEKSDWQGAALRFLDFLRTESDRGFCVQPLGAGHSRE